MKFLLWLGFLPLLCDGRVMAQITMRARDYPSRLGGVRKAYVNSRDPLVAGLIGGVGGPQVWDFSYPPVAGEEVHVIEIVSAKEGACAAEYPDARFAERTTPPSPGQPSWEYFSIEPEQGRRFYGLCAPGANSETSGVVFRPPTLQFTNCTYGTTWERSTSWSDTIGSLPVTIHFTAWGVVDGFGTILLPHLGRLPALRVSETHSYRNEFQGLLIGEQYFHDYYWLVPTIGKAVEIVSKASDVAVPENYSVAATVLRVFEGGALAAKGLRAQRQGEQVFLSWDSAGSDLTYLVTTSSVSQYPSLVAPGSSDGKLLHWASWQTVSQNFLFVPRPAFPTNSFFQVWVDP